MPIYEYKCEECGTRFEKIQSFKASHIQKCTKCGGSSKRQLSLGSFVLKGSGWYAPEKQPKPSREQKSDPKPSSDKKCKTCPAG
ncbi:zinc ribbon domain-containing protein [bacterium]|nr:zinc ribbon domain-containing protein [bacterium]